MAQHSELSPSSGCSVLPPAQVETGGLQGPNQHLGVWKQRFTDLNEKGYSGSPFIPLPGSQKTPAFHGRGFGKHQGKITSTKSTLIKS